MDNWTKEERSLYNKEYRRLNKERMDAYQEEYRKGYNNPYLAKDNPKRIINVLKLKYKVTKEQATNLFERSMQTCDCCDKQWSAEQRRFHVDHNHTTMVVRGILCHGCNVSLGMLKESTEIILKLANYNEKYKQTIVSI